MRLSILAIARESYAFSNHHSLLTYIHRWPPPLSCFTLPADHSDENGYTCLHAASAYNQLEIMRWLIANGANVNVGDTDGDTPLHHAEHVDAAQFLISSGANPAAMNIESKTPLALKLEDVIPDNHEDYDSDDEEQNELKRLVSYLTSVSPPPSTNLNMATTTTTTAMEE